MDISASPSNTTPWKAPWPFWIMVWWFITGWAVIPLMGSALSIDPLWASGGFWGLSTALACRVYGWKPALTTLGIVPAYFSGSLMQTGLRWSGQLLLFASLMALFGFAFTQLVPHWPSITAHLKTSTLPANLVFKAVWVSPWVEEFMFRGLLLGSIYPQGIEHDAHPFKQRCKQAFWPVVGVGLVFTLCHSQYTPSPWALAYVFGQAVILGYCRVQTGTLWIPILLHTLNNGISML